MSHMAHSLPHRCMYTTFSLTRCVHIFIFEILTWHLTCSVLFTLQPHVIQQQSPAAKPCHDVHGESRACVPLASDWDTKPPQGAFAGWSQGHDQHVHSWTRRGWQRPHVSTEGLHQRAAALPHRNCPAHSHLGLKWDHGGWGWTEREHQKSS